MTPTWFEVAGTATLARCEPATARTLALRETPLRREASLPSRMWCPGGSQVERAKGLEPEDHARFTSILHWANWAQGRKALGCVLLVPGTYDLGGGARLVVPGPPPNPFADSDGIDRRINDMCGGGLLGWLAQMSPLGAASDIAFIDELIRLGLNPEDYEQQPPYIVFACVPPLGTELTSQR